MKTFIQKQIQKTLTVISEIEKNPDFFSKIEQATQYCLDALKQQGKILFIGNGGSAADAQHLAAEIVGRLRMNRGALPAIALTTDTSVITAIANDNGYESIFARQIEALATHNDVLIAISTSGKSPNILQALIAARKKKLKLIGFSGLTSPQMNEWCDVVLNAPSTETSKIQECHIMFGHIICELIETTFFQQQDSSLQINMSEEHS